MTIDNKRITDSHSCESREEGPFTIKIELRGVNVNVMTSLTDFPEAGH